MSLSDSLQDTTAQIWSRLLTDLTECRVLHPQVFRYLTDHFDLQEEQIPGFIENTLPTLEAYEVDLAFSPLFTPTRAEKVTYHALRKGCSIPPEQIQAWIVKLCDAGLVATLNTPLGTSFRLPLQAVMIERFVNRLSLEKPLEPELGDAILQYAPKAAWGSLFLDACDSVWQFPWRKRLFTLLLQYYAEHQVLECDQRLLLLTDLLRTYRPEAVEDLPVRLESLIRSYQEDLDKADGRSFHDEHLKTFYANYEMNLAAEEAEHQQVASSYQEKMAAVQALLSDYRALEARHSAELLAIQTSD